MMGLNKIAGRGGKVLQQAMRCAGGSEKITGNPVPCTWPGRVI